MTKKGLILDANGATYKEKTDIIAVGGKKLADITPKEEVVELVQSDAPLMTSEQMDITPTGNYILARGFKVPEKTAGGIYIPEKQRGSVLPVLYTMKVGENVRIVKDNKYVRIKDDVTPAMISWEDEVFYLFQEYDVMFTYDTPPKMNHIMNSVTKITRDLTQYVEYDKLKDLRANITERMEGEMAV